MNIKRLLLLAAILLFKFNSHAQIVITANDMPDFNMVYKSETRNSTGNSFDYELTGPSFTWDVSSLSYSDAQFDTFVKVSKTPLIYNIYFSNNNDTARKATIASPSPLALPIPDLTIESIYFFYRETSVAFSEVGFGATINGYQIPVKYSEPDTWYKFPITYGTTDTSYSDFSLNIPSYGYLGETKMRINKVDGWGTLKTHKGTFPVIRIKSELYIEDTLYYADFDQGIRFSRDEIQYKWLGALSGVPLMQITERMAGASMQVLDSTLVNTTSVHETQGRLTAALYPNPASDYIIVNFQTEKPTPLHIKLTALDGKQVFEKKYSVVNGILIDRIDLKGAAVSNGFYMLTAETSEGVTVCPLVVN